MKGSRFLESIKILYSSPDAHLLVIILKLLTRKVALKDFLQEGI